MRDIRAFIEFVAPARPRKDAAEKSIRKCAIWRNGIAVALFMRMVGIPYFMVGQDAAGRKPKPMPWLPRTPLGNQPQAQIVDWRDCSAAINQPKKCGMRPVPRKSWSRALRRVWNAEILSARSANERKHGRAARRTASDRQTDYDSQYCNCNDNATDPYADQPSHAVAFALRHVGAKLFHIGAEPFQSAFILRLMCVHLFPQRRQFLGNLMGRRLAHRPIPVARRSSGAHRARRSIANPFGANGRFILPHSISLSAGRPSVFFAKARRGRRQLARRSRARTDHRAAHPASPSPPGIFSGRAIGASRSVRSGGCDAKSRQFEEAKPTQACEAASGGEQSSRQLSTCRTSEPKKMGCTPCESTN